MHDLEIDDGAEMDNLAAYEQEVDEYRLSHVDSDIGPWLVWDPPSEREEPSSREKRVAEMEEEGIFGNPGAFHDSVRGGYHLDVERTSLHLHADYFRPQYYYAETPKELGERIVDEADAMAEQLGSETQTAPLHLLPTLRAIRKEARGELEHFGRILSVDFIRPLRRALIPCVLEGGPATVFDNAWAVSRMMGLKAAIPMWHQIFAETPSPLADGAEEALYAYFARRDEILEQARPVFFKWEASRMLIWTALYNVTTEEVAACRPGRNRLEEDPQRVADVLDVVCKWLESDPPAVYNGEGGLVPFATDKFPCLTENGIRDHISTVMRRLTDDYPHYFPDPESWTRGDAYLESGEQIRKGRGFYKKRHGISEK